MKFLIIDTYYAGFLADFWRAHPKLLGQSFLKKRQALLDACFGTSDYYSYNLRKLGHQAQDLIINDKVSQRQWAKEHGLKVASAGFWAKLQSMPLVHRLIGRPSWVQEIALAQIKYYRPDVLYVQDLSALNPKTLKAAKNYCKLIVGQIACPPPAKENLLAFDLIMTSFPHFVSRFRKMGIKSEYFKIAFDQRTVKKIGHQKKIYDVSFIGSFTPAHSAGTKILEAVAKEIPLHVWGRGLEFLSPSSPLRKNYHGTAWGLDTYRILAASKIVINRHITAASHYANNMRLYETTATGAMLITDAKKNLGDLFKIDKEVIAYSSSSDLISKIRYYLDHETKRTQIAREGQNRTLNDHTYYRRMRELIKIIKKYER